MMEYPENIVKLAAFEEKNPNWRKGKRNSNKNNERHNVTPPKGYDVMMFEKTGLPLYPLGMATPPTPREYLIEGMLPKGYPAILYGDGGSLKSYIALTMAVDIAAGLPFCSRNTMQGLVVYFDFELDSIEMNRRVYEIAKGLGIKLPLDNLLHLNPYHEGVPDSISKQAQMIAKAEPIFTVIDSLGLAIQGDSEKAKDVTAYLKHLNPLGTVLCIDHQPRGSAGQEYSKKEPFGSVYKSNLCRSVLQLQANELPDGSLGLKMMHKKANFSRKFEPITYRASFPLGKFILEETDLPKGTFGKSETVQERIIAALKELERATAQEIADKTGDNVDTVRNKLTPMVKDKLVKEDGKKGRSKAYTLVA